MANEIEEASNDATTPETLTDGFEYLAETGIPKEVTDGWKTDHHTIFRILFLDEQYIYRGFTYKEYKEMRSNILRLMPDAAPIDSDTAFKEEIQKRCVLWPADYAERLDTEKPYALPGGIPGLLADYILAASGFSDALVPDVITGNFDRNA